jgi:hypothetical protein
MTEIKTRTVTFSDVDVARTGDRALEAEWFTDVRGGFDDGDEGWRVVTLRASHRDGVYRVTAGISTAVEQQFFKVRQFELFKDPLITLSKERARFSQKRLKTLFDTALADFDVESFYAAHEVDPR